jgi:hypothetical protein
MHRNQPAPHTLPVKGGGARPDDGRGCLPGKQMGSNKQKGGERRSTPIYN